MANFFAAHTQVCDAAPPHLWIRPSFPTARYLVRAHAALLVAAVILTATIASPLRAAQPAVQWVGGDASAALLGPGTGVTIGFVDSGISGTHPFFAGTDLLGQPRMVAQANFVTSEPGNNGADVFGHGTAVAAMALGRGEVDGENYNGMAPDARYVNARVLNSNNSFLSTDPIIRGVQFSLQNHADIINLSLVVNASQSDGNTKLDLMIDYLADARGVLVITCAGNFGVSVAPHAIGAARNAISMGALNADYSRVANFSVAGPTSDNRVKPDMVAPGQTVSTANVNWQSSGALVSNWSGTSFAAPQAAGMGAQLIDYGREHGLSTDQRVLRAVMINSAEKTLDHNGAPWAATSLLPLDSEQGSGRLDAVATALQYIAGSHAPGAVPNTGWALQEALGASNALNTAEAYALQLSPTLGSYIDATLVWNRHVVWSDFGEQNVIDPADSFFVSSSDPQDDLNLFLYKDGVQVASSTSASNTVEHIHFLVTAEGNYSIRVTRSAAVDAGETYALAWQSVAVPEPATLTLAAFGLVAWGVRRRRRR